MNSPTTFEFNWLSLLGVSVVLFLLNGILYILIGVSEPFVRKYSKAGQGALIRSDESDTALFGHQPTQLLKNDPQYALPGKILIHWIAALLVMVGIFLLSIVWFGLRQGQIWAFWAIVLSNIAALAGWLAVLLPVVRKRIPLGFDLPPVVLILAAFVLPIAGVLGWVGLS
jgi:hypothetical protein